MPSREPDYKKELEQFSYIVSHDLGAPIRHLKQFSSLLSNSVGDKLDGDEQKYLSIINNSAEKAQQMLGALLQYSRLSGKVSEYNRFDLDAAIKEVVQEKLDVYSLPPEAVSVDDVPQAFDGPSKDIVFIMSELVDNAMKFRRSDQAPHIIIAVNKQAENCLFRIQDNGIGISEKLREDAFNVFRRLNAENDYPGLGMGLAMSRKIIQNYGGEIWMEDGQDSGVTLCFTMPV